MISNNSVATDSDEQSPPPPTAPSPDPRSMASELTDIQDPYDEALRRKAALAGV
jgi:hypothetical protein